jgi:hypothetical protein
VVVKGLAMTEELGYLNITVTNTAPKNRAFASAKKGNDEVHGCCCISFGLGRGICPCPLCPQDKWGISIFFANVVSGMKDIALARIFS